MCLYNYIYACVNPAPRPISWTGKAGAGVFSVDGIVGGEWGYLQFFALIDLQSDIVS